MAFSIEALFFLRDRASGPARGIGAAAQSAAAKLSNAGTQGQTATGKIGAAATAAGGKLRGMGTQATSAGQQLSTGLARGKNAAATLGTGLNQASRNADRLTSSARRAGGAIQSALEKPMGAVTGLTGKIFSLQTALGALAAGAGIAMIGKGIVNAVGYKEQSLIAFTSLLKDAGSANRAYKDSIAFAASTPFETREVVEATKSLLSYGFGIRNIKSVMTSAGNVAAGMGKPLEQAVIAFSALRSGDFGQAFGVGQGFNQLGITREQLMGKGLVFDKKGSYKGSVESAMVAVQRIIKDRFGNGMAQQSRSIFGLVSTLQSRPFELFSSLDANGALKPFKNVLERIAEMTDFENNPTGRRIKASFTAFAGSIFKNGFQGVESFFTPKRVPTAKKIITSGHITTKYVMMSDAELMLDRVMNRITKFTKWVQTNGPIIIKGIQEIGAGIRDGFTTIRSAYETAKPFLEGIGDILGKIMPKGQGGSSLARTAGQVLVLVGALKLLNVVSLGASASLLRFAASAALKVVSVPIKFVAGKAGGLLARAAKNALVKSPVLNLARRAGGAVVRAGRDVLGNMGEVGRGAASFVKERIPVARAAVRTVMTRFLTSGTEKLKLAGQALKNFGAGAKTVAVNFATRGMGALKTDATLLGNLSARAVTATARFAVSGVQLLKSGVIALSSMGLTALRSAGQLALSAARGSVALIRLGVQSLLMGGRMAAAWLIGLGPIGWIIAGVALVGGALVLAYNKVGWFKDGVNAAWAWIKTATSSAAAWISSAFQNSLAFVQGLPAKVVGFFTGLPGQLQTIGTQMLQGLASGITGALAGVKDAVVGAGQSAIGWLKSTLGIASPSRVFMGLGGYVGDGFALGIGAARDASRVRRGAWRVQRCAAWAIPV